MDSNSSVPKKSSVWWLVVIAACGVFAAALLIAAFTFQRSATSPIGEGEVFVSDVSVISDLLEALPEPDEAVRRSRNALNVEAVSLLGPDGVITTSTSPTLVGSLLSSPLLAFGASNQRFMALAGEIPVELAIDGVVEWPAGSVLYQVLSPLDDGQLTLIHYDVSGLLQRRTQPGELQSETLQLIALGVVFVLLGIAGLVGHMRASRRHSQMALESQLLRQHSETLEATNHELDHALAVAEEKIRIRSEFVLMINHELRTPLTSVVTGAELLASGSLTPSDANQVVNSIVSDGHRLQDIIDQILAVARIENKGLTYELRATPLAEVCQAVSECHPRTLSGRHEVQEPMEVSTDISTLGIVVASLADNAFSHGATEVVVGCGTRTAVEPMVAVGSRPETAAFITVSDNGPGIEPDFLPRIFEKFEKASFSSGTGLGLYIVKLMVEALAGSIAVETSPQGTTFEIALPAIRIEELAAVS